MLLDEPLHNICCGWGSAWIILIHIEDSGSVHTEVVGCRWNRFLGCRDLIKYLTKAKNFAQTTALRRFNALACFHCFYCWQNQTALDEEEEEQCSLVNCLRRAEGSKNMYSPVPFRRQGSIDLHTSFIWHCTFSKIWGVWPLIGSIHSAKEVCLLYGLCCFLRILGHAHLFTGDMLFNWNTTH